jgi:hypothetical protein
MKVGGNAFAGDFFTKHGVSSLLSDVDTKKKYSSRVGELYKEELARRVKDDVARSVSSFTVKISHNETILLLGSPTGSLSMGLKPLLQRLPKRRQRMTSSILGPSLPHLYHPTLGHLASLLPPLSDDRSLLHPLPSPVPIPTPPPAAAKPLLLLVQLPHQPLLVQLV